MKTVALFIGILLGIIGFTGDSISLDRNVFTVSLNSKDASLQLKPLSRGDMPERSPQEGQLKLMTYNIHRGIGKSGKLDLDETIGVIKLGDASIIALQEVERYSIRTGFKDQIKYLAEQLGMNYSFGKSINILNGEYGNGLLSSYPIEEYQVIELPSYSEQRTVLRTVVSMGDHKLAVYNTHLGLKESERQEQIEFMLQIISEEALDYILMGDMNASAAKLKAITDVLQDSAAVMELQQMNTFVEEDVQERIDYIFTTSDMNIRDYQVILSDASDHYPALCEVMMKP